MSKILCDWQFLMTIGVVLILLKFFVLGAFLIGLAIGIAE